MNTEKAAYLAVKIKSLAAEAVIIRKDENYYRARHKASPEKTKAARETWLGLKWHRRFDVRQESRAALLAYGYLRGTSYLAIEAKCWLPPNWDRVAQIIIKFGDERDVKVVKAALKAWKSAPAELAEAA